jgi:hypothetical protein
LTPTPVVGAEEPIQRPHRIFLYVGQRVRVEIQSDADSGVAEYLTHHLGIDPPREEKGCRSVAQIVKAGGRVDAARQLGCPPLRYSGIEILRWPLISSGAKVVSVIGGHL